ncbi:MAG: DNA polymerase III subunit delta, partial [Polyangiaceae bacterium]|nr:DNA polymerase III subunit delta [Polyangiaceae bacterium]
MPDIQAVIRGAGEGRFEPVHVLAGAEAFLVDRAVRRLRRAVVGEGPMGFNEDVLSGQGLDGHRLVGIAQTLPMMASHRFVLVRNIDKASADALEPLIAYLASPSPSTCLVLTAEKLDKRSRFGKALTKANVVAQADAPKGAALAGFAQAEARSRGHSLPPDATRALLDAVGDDLAAIDDALERLSLFVGEGSAIELAAVEACVSRVRTETIWALVDGVSARDAKRTIAAATSLLADRQAPLYVLSMVARQLRMVARMREGLAQGLRPEEAAQAAGAPPFKARELMDAARRFNLPSLERAFSTIAATDRALKGSRRPEDAVLIEALL